MHDSKWDFGDQSYSLVQVGQEGQLDLDILSYIIENY